jgi:hypothetical protein
MDKQEFKQLVLALRSAYQKQDFLNTTQELDMWYQFLKDLDYKTLSLITQQWILTEKWPPKIADLRNGVAELYKLEMLDWGEAWAKTVQCMSKYGRLAPADAYNELGEFISEVIRGIGGWQMICLSENLVTERSNFRDLYNQRVERKVKEIALPMGLRMALKESISNKIGGKEKSVAGFIS